LVCFGFPILQKQRNMFGNTWVSDPSARWAMRSYMTASLHSN